jgi:protein-tyrosine phosphatase
MYRTVIRVLFVCTGNICRSPMAEAVFSKMVEDEGWGHLFEVRSVGTHSWHVGERPHVGTQGILRERGVPLHPDKRGEKLGAMDLKTYDYVIAMDEENVSDVERFFGVKVRRLLEFAPEGTQPNVPDPYYTGRFDQTFDLVSVGCRGLLSYIKQQEDL